MLEEDLENTLPDSLSRPFPPIPKDQALERKDGKQLKRSRRMILTKRADLIQEKDEYTYTRRISSKDKKLNLSAIQLDSDEYKSQATDYICPPKHDRSDIIREAHKLGHWGIDGVIKRIRICLGLHWNSIYDDFNSILLQCKDCARHNITKGGYNLLGSIVEFVSFSHIAIDTCGPFPMT
ncbi:hypothetical protein EDC96DRAFT_593692 [Choanephora cucurbitarum]|nr:hypothetical protein EDC96DRAFT_593692 [Choanephora cucurbitarum]